MGGQQTKPEESEKKRHAELRKMVSSNLQRSREKYLSSVLASSQPELDKLGQEDPDAHKSDAKEDTLTDNGVKPGTGSLEVNRISGSSSVRFPDFPDEGNLRDSVFRHQSESYHSDSEVEDLIMDGSKHDPLLKTERPKKSTMKIGKTIRKERKRTFHPLGRYDRSSSFYDEVDRMAARIDPSDFSFFFENLVFEGGGNKGLAYCGAVRYLEELGVMKRVKRFAGASAGGIVSGLLAVGYTSYDIEQFLSDRIDKVFLDASCGYLSLLPNIVRSFGWNPGKKIYDWFGDKLQDKTDNADITFMELYKKMGTELCIIVTNLSQMTTEYCHPKTTPDMPIRLALRMSMAIPGLFSAMKYRHFGQEDVYVDGGVLCNYPVHCFDGWYLSMDPRNSFLRKLQPLRDIPLLMERNNRFGSFNDKTLGMLLYSDAEEDILRINLERRVGCLQPAKPEPETKLFIQRTKEAQHRKKVEREYATVVNAVDSFLKVLKKHNMDENDVINKEELEAAFEDEEEFPRHEAEVLFGKDCTVSDAFQLLDSDGNGQIRFEELVRFIEETGVSIQSRFLGYQRREIKSFVSFLNTLTSTLTFNVQKLYVEERDLQRTVGINTGHVHTTDFVLEEPDREFVVQRGYNSMKAFLRYYAVNYPNNVEPRARGQGRCPDIQENHTADPSPADAAQSDKVTLAIAEDVS